jgi:hypothetical protein
MATTATKPRIRGTGAKTRTRLHHPRDSASWTPSEDLPGGVNASGKGSRGGRPSFPVPPRRGLRLPASSSDRGWYACGLHIVMFIFRLPRPVPAGYSASGCGASKMFYRLWNGNGLTSSRSSRSCSKIFIVIILSQLQFWCTATRARTFTSTSMRLQERQDLEFRQDMEDLMIPAGRRRATGAGA